MDFSQPEQPQYYNDQRSENCYQQNTDSGGKLYEAKVYVAENSRKADQDCDKAKHSHSVNLSAINLQVLHIIVSSR